jgi:hypothetical protein
MRFPIPAPAIHATPNPLARNYPLWRKNVKGKEDEKHWSILNKL